MSYAEHLIENAITILKQSGDYRQFADDHTNKVMARTCRIPLEAVWEMANYVVYTHDQRREA